MERNLGLGKTFDLNLSDQRIEIGQADPSRQFWKHLAVFSPNEQSRTIGTWTMVYDEGFEINLSHSHYFGKLSKHISLPFHNLSNSNNWPLNPPGDSEDQFGQLRCYITGHDPTQTLIGWFTKHAEAPSQYFWGCFYAEKKSQQQRQEPSNFRNYPYVIENVTALPQLPTQHFVMLQNRKLAFYSI
ncbi:hypothetical protein IE077_000989 [Cardiosporidium cionae]|uniref:Cathepsin C exclusion domain-containing protein n=1 Tax=Cardiosporidium cionae TaxID=476202 RepID=A0ABQ7JGB7_9APIC|nr:hypothetical protein IE077_000989 [Cardiosporidium cionae]|eukprot:KAF8823067.1 hypothetical protein IE077_000989 [Cardiosporidium cionae]